MRQRLLVMCAVVVLAAPLFGKDIYLSIGGTTGNFHTDMRLFNPSTTKDIQVTAYLLATGNADNTGATTKIITVPKRQMLVYNDVISYLFGVGGLGGLRLKSDDDFIATQRIYALAPDGSTTGQYIPGLDTSGAKKKGLIIQLRNNGTGLGTFRTNIGAVNPNATAANVIWRLYDKNNQQVGQPMTETLAPFAVKAPTSIGAFTTGTGIATADLSDAWISYDSDQPLFAYASVVDNGTADGTLIPNFEDTGVLVNTQPPQAEGKVFDVTLRSGQILISPTPGPDVLQNGDKISFRIHSEDVEHGFRVVSPTGAIVTDKTYKPADGIVVVTTTINREGTWAHLCTITTCSAGHNNMYGTFVVGEPDDYEKPGYN